MIFDSLTHCTPAGDWFGTSHNASFSRLKAEVGKHRVSRLVLSGLVETSVNEFIIDKFQEFPRLIYPVPMITKGDLTFLDLQIANYAKVGVKGVKLHPRFLESELQETRLDALFEMCNERNLTLFICTVPFYGPSNVRFADALLRRCIEWPHLKMVLLHGGYYSLLEVAERVRPFENILIDLSATLPRFHDSSLGADIKYLYRNFSKRLVIGTDFPEYTYDDVYRSLKHLGIPWKAALSSGVLGDNLNQFLE